MDGFADARILQTREPSIQYRERSDRMPHSIVILKIALLSVASGRCARGTVMVVSLPFEKAVRANRCAPASVTARV